MSRIVIAACAAVAPRRRQRLPRRNDDPSLTWDLNDLYPTIAAWDGERAALEKEIRGVAQFKGTLGRDAKSMLKAFDAMAPTRQAACHGLRSMRR